MRRRGAEFASCSPCGENTPFLYQLRSRDPAFARFTGSKPGSAHRSNGSHGPGCFGARRSAWKVRDPAMGKVIGIDLGTTNSCVAVMEGTHAQGHRERGRGAHHAVHRRLHGRRRAPRRPAGQAPGGDQSRAHLLRHQAPDRAHLRRSHDQEGHGPRPLQDHQGRQQRRLGRGRRQAVLAVADLGLHPAEDEGDRGGLSRPAGHAGRHHRSGLLQRRPAPGDQGRRQDRRPRGAAHHQRADGGGARLRPRQEEGRARSRSTTSAAAPSTSRSSRSATACSR